MSETAKGEGIRKAPVGITGLDEVLGGGFPAGRPTLICGGAGSGKTLLAMEFLVRGAAEFGEPGVFISFEESVKDLASNVASLGFDLPGLIEDKRLYIDHVRIERSEIEETGAYDLEGLFVRINYAVQTVGAKRVVLDTVETLFSGLDDAGILRAELVRLFRWLKDQGLTAVITAERGDEGSLTRHGLEEYVSNCVINLDHRVQDQISTRRLRIVKYRGTAHGTNEYPFIIDEDGFSVMPVTSLGLEHVSSDERMSTGVPGLDAMLEGEGFFRGSSVLISGTPGTGKTTFAASIVKAACDRGERAVYFAFEESPSQIMRNMQSVGIDLRPAVDAGLLRFHASRPTLYGMEQHLVTMYRLIEEVRPEVVVMDPMSNLSHAGSTQAASSALLRLVDHLKRQNITAVFTNLTQSGEPQEQTDVAVSSLMDTWVLLRDVESSGERNHAVYVLKSRGMAHSNQIREFTFTPEGIHMVDVYVGAGGVLTGSARVAQEAQDQAMQLQRRQELDRQQRELERKRRQAEAQIALLRAQWETEEEELQQKIAQAEAREQQALRDQRDMAASRRDDREEHEPRK